MSRPTELDRWARVLAVSNDNEALTELDRLHERLKGMAYLLLRIEVTLRDAPDLDLLEAVRQGREDAINLWAAVGVVKRKFRAHERGDR